MIEYVAGVVLFGKEANMAILVRKRRPDWQAGRINFIGGKIEPGEEPYQAMEREFEEEAGANLKYWKRFCVLEGDGWKVHFFVRFALLEELTNVHTITDEEIGTYDLTVTSFYKECLPNLAWLIPMAKTMHREKAEEFYIKEVY